MQISAPQGLRFKTVSDPVVDAASPCREAGRMIIRAAVFRENRGLSTIVSYRLFVKTA